MKYLKLILGFSVLLFVSVNSDAATQVYNIPLGSLVNMPNNCGSAGPYSNCASGQQIGFNWTDVLPAGSVVTAVNIQFRAGVECSAGAKTWYLNGVSQGSHTTTGNGCSCSVGGTPVSSLNASVANYNVGGANQFRITTGTSCLGFYNHWGSYYGVVTVTYTNCTPSSISNPSSTPAGVLNVWTGAGSSDGAYPGDWNRADNWTNGVPTIGHNVVIPYCPTKQPVIYGGGSGTMQAAQFSPWPQAYCNTITVHMNDGATLTFNTGTALLDVRGAF